MRSPLSRFGVGVTPRPPTRESVPVDRTGGPETALSGTLGTGRRDVTGSRTATGRGGYDPEASVALRSLASVIVVP